MGTKYDNMDWSRCAGNGGVTLALLAADGAGQGNDGVSLPCRGCWVQRRELGNTIRMNIGEAATVDLGIELGDPEEGAMPLWVPISDISQLYFYGTAADIVDIIYLLG